MKTATKKKTFDPWDFLSNVKPKEAKQAVKCLEEALELFGPKGKYWVKEEETGEMEDSKGNTFETYCAIGALHKADGPGEKLAFVALGTALDAIDLDMEEKRKEAIYGAIEDAANEDFDSAEEAAEYIKERARVSQVGINELHEAAEEGIPAVNDAKSTTFRSIADGFKLAIRKLQAVK